MEESNSIKEQDQENPKETSWEELVSLEISMKQT